MSQQRIDTRLDNRIKGISMAIGASALWGLSGNVAQSVFENYGVSAPWLVNLRLLGAGILCLILSVITRGTRDTLGILKDPRDRFKLVIYAIFGMVAVQYTFFSCIQAGNAATATLLQYACPIFLVTWFTFRNMKLPSLVEMAACLLAIPGIALLVTNGSTGTLAVSGSAVAWGLASAAAAAFYISYPNRLIKQWGASAVTGWAMLLGGLLAAPFLHPWNPGTAVFTASSLFAISFVVVFGTFASFVLYLNSTRYISPTEASLLGSAEPLTAAAVSILWLHEKLGVWQAVGGLLVIITVALLSAAPKEVHAESVPCLEEA